MISPLNRIAPPRPLLIGGLLGCALWITSPPMPAQEELPGPKKDEVGEYLDAINQAQTLDGPYSSELADLYYGYAQALIEEGDLEAARDAFHRTVMVTRVNSGPNSIEQTNYLYGLAEIESQLGNLEETIAVIEHIYLLNARQYGEDSPELLPVVEQLNDWYMTVRPLRGPMVGASDYQNRSFLRGKIAGLTEAEKGLGSSETALKYRELSQVQFYAILHILRTAEIPQPELILNSEFAGSSDMFQRSPGSHYKTGEEALERAVESWRTNPDASELQLAEATAQLGDWYLALRHFRAAERQYERAYQLLKNSQEYASIADEYLGTPTPLRFMNTSGSFVRELAAPVANENLEISMTVTRNGRLMDVEYVNTPSGESQEDLATFKQRLENTRFRPAVINGKVETLEHFVWKPPLPSAKIAARQE